MGLTVPKTYRAINIRGNVDVADWTNLFPSFIKTLKDNNLQLNVSIRAKSTVANPLTENSRTVTIVKESASQLGLDFLVEE